MIDSGVRDRRTSPPPLKMTVRDRLWWAALHQALWARQPPPPPPSFLERIAGWFTLSDLVYLIIYMLIPLLCGMLVCGFEDHVCLYGHQEKGGEPLRLIESFWRSVIQSIGYTLDLIVFYHPGHPHDPDIFFQTAFDFMADVMVSGLLKFEAVIVMVPVDLFTGDFYHMITVLPRLMIEAIWSMISAPLRFGYVMGKHPFVGPPSRPSPSYWSLSCLFTEAAFYDQCGTENQHSIR